MSTSRVNAVGLLPFLAVLLLTSCSTARGEEIAFGGGTWIAAGEEARTVSYKGRSALFLREASAELQAVEFESGTIEFDVAVPEQRGFTGIRFRKQDSGNFENFYIRPHQSGQPDANQYQPVFNGNSSWQIHYGPQYSTPVQYQFDAWMHVRLEVAGDKADVYINSTEPVLHIVDLKRDPAKGSIEFYSSTIGTYYADIKVVPDSGVRVVDTPAAEADLPDGLVTQWEVSPPIAFDAVTSISDLSELELGAADWSSLSVETNGIANLGRLATLSDGSNTVLARLVIPSNARRPQLLRFGYSDEVRVFVNGRPVYEGTNLYRSRDHRYLGTVGLFDGLILALEPGRNEVIFAVREEFGGWAVMAQLVD